MCGVQNLANGRGIQDGGTCVYLWRIHVDVWQKPIQYCKVIAAAAAKSLQSCLTLCDPIDGSPPGSPIPGILQAKLLEWLPFPFPMHESEK